MFRTAGYYFLALFALAVAAFWKSYVVKPQAFGEPWTHIHAALMVAWFGILIAQPFLIRRERRAMHRLLGRISYGVVPALAASILIVMHVRIRALGPVGDDARFFWLPFGMTILLVVPWALAIKHRREVAVHARYMICTAFAMFDPIIGRVLYFSGVELPSPDYGPVVSYLAIATILVVLIVREREHRVGRRVYPFMLGLTTVVFAAFGTFARGVTWRELVEWFGAIG